MAAVAVNHSRHSGSGAAIGCPAVSVVVSTRNRAAALPGFFAALAAMESPHPGDWELVIVDNGSTDDTAAVIRSQAAACGFPVVHLYEERPGKSRGLNSGIAASHGRIIALTDDDGLPATDWLVSLARFFAEHPGVDCVGGRVELHDPTDAPLAVRTSRNCGWVDATSFDPANIIVIGCNMAIRKSALDSIGPFDVDVGPGSRIGVAEDVDMLYRIVRRGGTVHYCPDILVWHAHGRKESSALAAANDQYLLGRGALYMKYLLASDRLLLRRLYWECAGELREVISGRFLGRRAMMAWHRLRLLCAGALRYWRFRSRPVGVAAT